MKQIYAACETTRTQMYSFEHTSTILESSAFDLIKTNMPLELYSYISDV